MNKTCRRYALLTMFFLFVATGDEIGLLPTIIIGSIGIYFFKRFIETMEEL